MTQKRHLEDLIYSKIFRFDHLDIKDIDNEPAVKIFSESVLEQEICLFANTVSVERLLQDAHEKIMNALRNHRPLPVVRFADGEYAFYRYTLGCNGLYKQAESIEAIKKAMPLYLAAMGYLSGHGVFAPLVFPGNSQVPSTNLFAIKTQKPDSTGAAFLDFMQENRIPLTADNYIPFYAVYAYLSSADFAAAVNGRNICILNSEYNEESCRNWFIRQNSSPNLMFVSIPREYVATRWDEVKIPILNKIPDGTDLCIVGAGVGALLICRDVAERFSIPAIDAGHVLNMMNDRVDKSNGARLYTLRRTHE